MSQPTFPEINPDMTHDYALNMILTSIAMEETALGNIINAESEKLKYVIESLTQCDSGKHDLDCLLAVNQSITRLLDSVTQNQMLLKNKMESVLQAMPTTGKCPICCECPCISNCYPPDLCPCPTPPIICPPFPSQERCLAVFRGAQHFETWRESCPIPWTCETAHGQCIVGSNRDNAKITLSAGCYTVAFAVNVKRRSSGSAERNIIINLRKLTANRRSDIFTYHYPMPCSDESITLMASGIIAETHDECENISLMLELISPESLKVERAMLSIIKI